jgi:hypothetical protein
MATIDNESFRFVSFVILLFKRLDFIFYLFRVNTHFSLDYMLSTSYEFVRGTKVLYIFCLFRFPKIDFWLF